jgi:hypothetical protein
MTLIRLLLALTLIVYSVANSSAAVLAADANSGFTRIDDLKSKTESLQVISGLSNEQSRSLLLADGEYFIENRQTAKTKFCLSTQFIQIRASGESELIVQVNASSCRVAVLKGEAVMKNATERSLIKVEPGAVYEFVLNAGDRHDRSIGDRFAFDFVTADSRTRVFKTTQATTSLFAVNPSALKLTSRTLCAENRLAKLLDPCKKAEIVCPPTTCRYDAGCALQDRLRIPLHLVQHFPPAGLLSADLPVAPEMAEAIVHDTVKVTESAL